MDLIYLQQCTNSVMSLCATQGISTSLFVGHLQEACRTVLDSLFDNSVNYLTEKMMTDTWKYIEDLEAIQQIRKNVNVILGISEMKEHHQQDVLIGNNFYRVTVSMKAFVSVLHEHKIFFDAYPSFSGEIYQKIVQFFRLFNSRTCQLVLGAGAMQSAGLKSISVRHLTVSREQITMSRDILLDFRKTITTQCPSRMQPLLMNEFDRVLKVCCDCLNEYLSHCHIIDVFDFI